MPNFFCYDGFLSIIQMRCFRLLHETISLQFGYKDSAKNRFSEEKENELSFLSVRFLFKSKTIHNLQR